MTEQMKQALEDAAKGLSWSQGQIILDKETFKQDISNIPLEKMVVVPIPDKVKTSVLFGAHWYLNNLWHDAKKERPDHDLFLVLVKTIFGDYHLNYYGNLKNKWDFYKSWAYFEDLLPDNLEASNK